MKIVFYCHNYYENKEVKFLVIEFLDHSIVWWE